MRYLIISDIHANLEALEAVLKHAAGSFDGILNCGDLVGYGPDPNAVVEWCRTYSPHVVRGNHDKVCATLENLDWFNPVAAESAAWTHKALEPQHLEYLKNLPQGPLTLNGFQLVHGSPFDEDEYLIHPDEVKFAARMLKRPLAFFGHTHIPGCYLVCRDQVQLLRRDSVDLAPGSVYMVNPGSVGQPRDRNPEAAYAIYDSDRRFVELRRVPYDIPATQKKIIDLGLPDVLAVRLGVGR